MDQPLRFRLQRDVDVSGASGTGHVADGVEFPDGTAVIRWRTEHRSTAVYNSVEELEIIHGHAGATRVVWIDEPSDQADHPHTDPGDGRTECYDCGKFVFPVTHSCKRIPVTARARERFDRERNGRWLA